MTLNSATRSWTLPLMKGWARVCIVALMMFAGLGCLSASTAEVRGELVNLSSDNERMISYRHQQHLWATADGSYHLLINRGSLQPDPGLSVFSSDDHGLNWRPVHHLPDSDELSTGDVVLAGNSMLIVYKSASDELLLDTLTYAGGVWTFQSREVVFAAPDALATNPAMAFDADGRLWCGYVERARDGASTNIRLTVRGAGGTWVRTNQVFGPTDNKSIERSARPVRTAQGIGMVFKVRNRTYWASHAGGDVNDPWQTSLIFEGIEIPRWLDPYASHFSAVVDSAGRVHLVLSENRDLLYLRSDDGSGTWSVPVQLDDERNVVYAQLVTSGDRLVVAFGPTSPEVADRGSVLISGDGGLSFTTVADLRPQARLRRAKYQTPRVELPVNGTGPMLVLQQMELSRLQRLQRYEVPLP